jgi:heterodisulfide reductase subunit A
VPGESGLLAGLPLRNTAPLPEIIQKYGNILRLDAKPGYAPCRLACPAGCNAEEYKRHIAEGKFQEALDSFRDFSPFAGVLGRICTHPCEDDCQRGLIENPLSIRTLKRFMADVELKAGVGQSQGSQISNNNRIAIVGSGPAGLSCAYDLIKNAYPVTVFEAAPESGGMLRYGIPNYRLPKEVLDHEISYIQNLGVEITTGREIKEISDLFSEGYKAVFLSTGAWLPRTLPSVTATEEGVLFGLDFLRDVNSGKEFHLGKRVFVVGGGSVAIDAARVAWRLGAEEVHIVCLETRDLRSPERMPAQESEVLEAEEEGIIINPSLKI